MANEILRAAFDYDYLPPVNVSGGILLGWNSDCWTVSDVTEGRFTLPAILTETTSSRDSWWITAVYGPQLDHEKVEFVDELLHFWESCPGPWFICGDFNMIYRAQDRKWPARSSLHEAFPLVPQQNAPRGVKPHWEKIHMVE